MRNIILKTIIAALFALFPAMGLAAELNGAGATFPSNLYNAWINTYKTLTTNLDIKYDAVGSGEGISRFSSGSVDFGATERPMTAAEMQAVPEGVLHIPSTAGMVVVAYNLPGARADLRLSRKALAGIMNGKIKTWNHQLIREANPGAKLPAKPITIVARNDSSGTSFAFTTHLIEIGGAKNRSAVNFEWPPNSVTATGNKGVAERIQKSPYSLGYIEYSFALEVGLKTAWLENKAGQFVRASIATGAAALESSLRQMPADGRQIIPDPVGEHAYPIVSYSWILVRKEQADREKAYLLRHLIYWGLNEGQFMARDNGYIPLPPPVAARAAEILSSMH